MSVKLVPLGNLCAFINGGTPSKQVPEYYSGHIPWITGTDIANGTVTQARSHITERAIRESATNLVKEGTLLLVTRTSVGKAALAYSDLCFSQDITAILPEETLLDKRYLLQFIQAKQSYFISVQRGATIQGITRDILESLKIPLVHLAEQKRIATILDEVEALRRKRLEAITKLDDFVQSNFLDMFGDPLTNPKGWTTADIGEVCSEIYRYPTFYGFVYQETGVPVVRIGNILLNGIVDNEIKNYVFVSADIARQFPRTTLELGDILMAVRGDGSTGKRIGLVTSTALVGANISPNLLRFKADQKQVNYQYLYHFLTSQAGQSLIDNYITRTAKKTITAQNIRTIPVMCPPFPLQEEFAHRLAHINVLREKSQTSLQHMENLFAALQHQAFSISPNGTPAEKPPIQPCLTLDF